VDPDILLKSGRPLVGLLAPKRQRCTAGSTATGTDNHWHARPSTALASWRSRPDVVRAGSSHPEDHWPDQFWMPGHLGKPRIRAVQACSVGLHLADVIPRNGSQTMTGCTGQAAVLPGKTTWHRHGGRRYVHQRTAIWSRPSQKRADTAMYEDKDDDRLEAAGR
jgi:hypothetical protein